MEARAEPVSGVHIPESYEGHGMSVIADATCLSFLLLWVILLVIAMIWFGPHDNG